MKHCALLVLGFLAATIAPPVLGQDKDKEAEKLFREMEKKIRGAKALEIVFTYEFDGKKAKGSWFLKNGDKARLRVSGHYYPGIKGNPTFELVSDGKRYKTKGAAIGVATNGVPYIDPEGEPTAGDTGKGFSALGAVILSRGGTFMAVCGLPYWTQGGGDIDPDKEESKMTVHDFKAGAAEKVGKRQAKVLSYRFGKGGNDDAEVTLWIDAETVLPLKRVFSNPKGVLQIRVTETYSEFKLDPKIDSNAFELPK